MQCDNITHRLIFETFENLTFLSFPRKRESMKPLKRLDSRFHGNDKLPSLGRNSKVSILQLARQIRRQVIQGYGEIEFQPLNDLDADLHASGPAFMKMAAGFAPAR
jgi:hypothetical protein